MWHQEPAGVIETADADIAETVSVHAHARDGEFFNYEKTLFKTEL